MTHSLDCDTPLFVVHVSNMAAELVETQVQDVPEIVDQARQGWRTHQLWSDGQKREFTLKQLNNFWRLLEENKQAICQALKDDLNKSEVETTMMEFNVVLADLMMFIRDYDDLSKPRPISKGLGNLFDDLYVKPEPYGLVLIYGAWNYPLSLVAQPLIGAMATGNAVIVKPSELSVRTSNLFATLIPKYLDQNYYKVITGGADVAQAVLKERFNYIFYTGSTNVGRIVMAEAAKTLTPVTLELGGKSPAIVTDDANLRIAAKRIMWGKLANCGQTCIAPDYVLLASPAMRDQFIEYCKKSITAFFGEDPAKSNDLGRIVNRRHFDRITKLMASSKGKNVLSGDTDVNERYIAPAIFVDVDGDDALMQEELFGPVLPVLTVNGIDEAIQFVNERERPLAFYVFTENKATFERVVRSTSTGAVVQNNTLMYAGAASFPFGGVGNSGMGAYHGKCTFETFSHMKPVFRSGTKLDFLQDVVYPPYTKSKIQQANFIQLPSMRRWSIVKPVVLLLLVAVIGIFTQIYGIPSWIYKL